jgi:phosphoglycerate dehydrogenase-like enzyme
VSDDRERPVVVVMGADGDEPPPGIDRIAGLVELRYAPDFEALDAIISDADVIYSWWGRTEDLEALWPKTARLRWVQAANVGVDGMLFPSLVKSDVILTNAGGAADRPIAESVLGFVVAMAKGFPRMFEDQRAHLWGHNDTERIRGQRLLVVGPGPIGREIARACVRGLGMRAEAVGRTPRQGDADLERIRGIDEIHTAVAEADVVVDSLPLTPQTLRLFDAGVFASMKPTARFVNIGRGGTVDEPALIAALREGRLAGAALDVFDDEPLRPESPLWDLAKVIISPHTSGNVVGWQADFAAVFYENVERWITGQPLRNVVDKRLGFPAAG